MKKIKTIHRMLCNCANSLKKRIDKLEKKDDYDSWERRMRLENSVMKINSAIYSIEKILGGECDD